MLEIAIVEDEEAAAQRLQSCLERYFAEQNEPFQVTRFARTSLFLDGYDPRFDLVFMDIQLPDGNGMDAARKLRTMDPTVSLIFVTNLAQYAVKSYEVEALDFVVKPVNYYQLAMKMNRALRVIHRRQGIRLTVATEHGLRVLPSQELVLVEVFDHQLVYHTEQEQFQTRGSLSRLEEQLKGQGFIRISVNCLISMRHVTAVEGSEVRLTGGERRFISRAQKKVVLRTLAEFLGGSR